jgi:hypothetical protein
MESCGLDSSGSEEGPVMSYVTTVINFRGALKGGEFLDWLHKKDFAPWTYLLSYLLRAARYSLKR